MLPRRALLAGGGREDPDDVVRLREGARIVGLLCQDQRLLRARRRLDGVAAAMRCQAPIGLELRAEHRASSGPASGGLANALSASSHAPRRRCSSADPLLDLGERLPVRLRRRALIARQRRPVVALERLEIADRELQRRHIRVPVRERRRGSGRAPSRSRRGSAPRRPRRRTAAAAATSSPASAR